jgi:hypothetical protein
MAEQGVNGSGRVSLHVAIGDASCAIMKHGRLLDLIDYTVENGRRQREFPETAGCDAALTVWN